MEHFIVSARKYRPQKFADVVGQDAITNTLENAIKNNHLAQALLFTGPRGVGKTTCARILAKMINQDSSDQHLEEEDFAFNIFELDAASNNSVDDIRTLTDQVRIPPQTGKFKVYIIDEVHMLSPAAFNAFLKTLEEPPAHAIFILATTEKHKIIPTILSRCQIFDFKRIGVLDIKNYLKKIAKEENVTAEDDALHIIAQKADGALRDALSIFDRVVSFSGNNLSRSAVTENLNVLDYDVYFEITKLLLENNIPQVLLKFNEVLVSGFEGHHFISGLASHFRDLLVAKDVGTIALLEVGDSAKKQYLEQSKNSDMKFLLDAIDLSNDCDLKYKTSKNQRLLVELTLMKLASINFEKQKKKSKNFIIPSAYFLTTNKNDEEVIPQAKVEESREENKYKPPAEKIQKVNLQKDKIEVIETVTPKETEVAVKINLKNATRRNSALSISSIQRNKLEEESLRKKQNSSIDTQNLPREEFSKEEFKQVWNSYVESLHGNGEKIFASLLKADTPELENNMIVMTYPNQLMKSELNKVKSKALKYLRQKLNNYDIDFKIIVNEEKEKNFAYTPQEKYEFLKEKNKALSILRKTFNLEL